MLVEAVVAVALIAISGAAALTFAAGVTHATARTRQSATLTLTAQNILTDLRAATVYDASLLPALAGKSVAFDLTGLAPDGSPQRTHITVSVGLPAGGRFIGTVSAGGSGGASVEMHATLAAEAPAPGAILSASTPPPAAIDHGSGDLSQIVL